jgi:hypothetical protein
MSAMRTESITNFRVIVERNTYDTSDLGVK